MKLTEIFNQLTYGEFRMLAIGGATLGKIDEANYAAVIPHINLGLTALYNRFKLKENRLNLLLQAGQRTYPLESKFAISSTKSNELVRYIIDPLMTPFLDDILKIERIFTDTGDELTVNQHGDPMTVYTPSLTTITVPAELATLETVKNLSVVYRANHPYLELKAGFIDIGHTNIELPYSHLEALLYFVASRVHNPLGMQQEFNMGNNYAMKYEQACQMLERQSNEADHATENHRLTRMGWV